jgi:hypothetical protein
VKISNEIMYSGQIFMICVSCVGLKFHGVISNIHILIQFILYVSALRCCLTCACINEKYQYMIGHPCTLLRTTLPSKQISKKTPTQLLIEGLTKHIVLVNLHKLSSYSKRLATCWLSL